MPRFGPCTFWIVLYYLCLLRQELDWKRSDYVISTKLFWGGKGVNDRGLNRKHLIEGIKACNTGPLFTP